MKTELEAGSKYSKTEKLETSAREEPELLLAYSPMSKQQSGNYTNQPEVLDAKSPSKYSLAQTNPISMTEQGRSINVPLQVHNNAP